MLDGRDFGLPSGLPISNFKYERLSKEHELLKEKYDKMVNELAQEKEANKSKPAAVTDNSKNEDLTNCKIKIKIPLFICQHIFNVNS